jgi:hypothetical protein
MLVRNTPTISKIISSSLTRTKIMIIKAGTSKSLQRETMGAITNVESLKKSIKMCFRSIII